MKQHFPSQQGFSLVEVLVAVTILLLVIVGPMTISSSVAKSTSFSSEQVVAFFLAQEGVELMQAARDNVILQGDLWEDFTDDIGGTYADCFSPDGCGLELNTDLDGTLDITDCGSGGADCRLYYDGGDNTRARYTHTGAGLEATPYTRIIKLSWDGGDEVKVVSEVTWRTGSLRAEQKAVMETYLFNVYVSINP